MLLLNHRKAGLERAARHLPETTRVTVCERASGAMLKADAYVPGDRTNVVSREGIVFLARQVLQQEWHVRGVAVMVLAAALDC